jgi:hypothetical protein
MDRQKRKSFQDRRPKDIERVRGTQQGRWCTKHLQEDAKTEQHNKSDNAVLGLHEEGAHFLTGLRPVTD